MNCFGERLKKLRRNAEMTQKELADQIGIGQSAVGKYERIEEAYPSVEVLLKIADIFHVGTDYLLRDTATTPVVENNISGHLSNSPFIQANNGGMVINGEEKEFSPEAMELLHIYNRLSGRDRLKLLNFAVGLEGATK